MSLSYLLHKFCFEQSEYCPIFAIPNFSVQSQRNGAFPFIHTPKFFEAHTGNLYRNVQMRSKGAVLPTVGFVYLEGTMSSNTKHAPGAEQDQLHNNPHSASPAPLPAPFSVEHIYNRKKRKPEITYYVNPRGAVVCRVSYTNAKGGVQ